MCVYIAYLYTIDIVSFLEFPLYFLFDEAHCTILYLVVDKDFKIQYIIMFKRYWFFSLPRILYIWTFSPHQLSVSFQFIINKNKQKKTNINNPLNYEKTTTIILHKLIWRNAAYRFILRNNIWQLFLNNTIYFLWAILFECLLFSLT